MASLKIGALADRQTGGQRVYGDADVKRLGFIRRCREFGFSIEQVRSPVALVQDPQSSCMHARDLAQEHLSAMRAKLSELKAWNAASPRSSRTAMRPVPVGRDRTA